MYFWDIYDTIQENKKDEIIMRIYRLCSLLAALLMAAAMPAGCAAVSGNGFNVCSHLSSVFVSIYVRMELFAPAFGQRVSKTG